MATIDRLAELQRAARQSRNSRTIDPDDHLQNPLLNTRENQVLQRIIGLFDDMKENLRKVNENLTILDQMGDAHLQTVDPAAERQIAAAMRKIVKTNVDFFNKNKELIAVIKTVAATDAASAVANNKEFIESNFRNLVEENGRVMKLSLAKEADFENKLRGKIKRGLKAVDPTMDDQQLETIVRDPAQVEQVLQAKMLGPVHLQVQNYLRDVKEKYNDILVLENNVRVINELIRQIADLVVENHDKILAVGGHVDDAHQATEKGKESLKKAEEYAEAGFKNRCWCLLAILGLCAVVMLPVLMSILNARGVL